MPTENKPLDLVKLAKAALDLKLDRDMLGRVISHSEYTEKRGEGQFLFGVTGLAIDFSNKMISGEIKPDNELARTFWAELIHDGRFQRLMANHIQHALKVSGIALPGEELDPDGTTKSFVAAAIAGADEAARRTGRG